MTTMVACCPSLWTAHRIPGHCPVALQTSRSAAGAERGGPVRTAGDPLGLIKRDLRSLWQDLRLRSWLSGTAVMPRDLTDRAGLAPAGRGLYEALLRGLPEACLKDFTQARFGALQDAASGGKWDRHPVDLRWSLPLLFERWCQVVLAGPERRGDLRRLEERSRKPAVTLANAAFLAAPASGGTVMGSALFALPFTWFYRCKP